MISINLRYIYTHKIIFQKYKEILLFRKMYNTSYFQMYLVIHLTSTFKIWTLNLSHKKIVILKIFIPKAIMHYHIYS